MADHFIQDATKSHKGLFAKKAREHGESTREYAKQEEHASGTLGREARLAETLMDMSHKAHGGRKFGEARF